VKARRDNPSGAKPRNVQIDNSAPTDAVAHASRHRQSPVGAAEADRPKMKDNTMEFPLFKRYFQERKVYRRVVHELSFCTDRDLRDLGFERCDIPRIAWVAARESRAA
jgi:uncharacterized protein YjiS (DUF1127 family)